MPRQTFAALFVLAMVATIVAIDVAFLRGRFWLRLAANITIVASFASLWWLLRRR